MRKCGIWNMDSRSKPNVGPAAGTLNVGTAAPGGRSGAARLQGQPIQCESLFAITTGGFFQQNSRHESRRSRQQPFDPPHLDRLKLRQIRSAIEEADAQSPDHATEADHKSKERGCRQADPALDLVKMQIPQPSRERSFAPIVRSQADPLSRPTRTACPNRI